jgi:tetratricopeptide (TPR) repeat protein
MNAKKYLAAFFLIVLCQLSFSQPTLTYKNKADSLRNEGNLKDAFIEYQKLYAQTPGDNNILYDYACVLSLFGQNDSCFKYLDTYLTLDTSLNAMIDPDFYPLRRDERWTGFETKLIERLTIKNKHAFKDVEYAKELWRIRALDQFGFSEIGIAIRKTGPNSSVVRGLWECKFIIGKNNQEELDELMSKKGWPRIDEVGKEAAGTAFFVIMHSNSTLIRKYLPEIQAMYKAKELIGMQYASLYDRALWYDKKPQRYGTHTQFNETTGKEELYPLEDEKKVDAYRKELGLEPLQDYLKKMNILFIPANR